jgi:hypothetical protein
MKNLLIVLVLSISLFGFKLVPTKNNLKSNPTEILACKFSQCQATAKSTGQQCKHCVSKNGDKYCFQHK